MSYCINCFKDSKGKEYCLDCYKKYKSAIDTKNEVIILNDDNSQFKKFHLPARNPKNVKASRQSKREIECLNGNKVRSKSEKIISDFLTLRRIKHSYEKALEIDTLEKQYIFPDFFIPVLITDNGKIIENVYIEHFGGPKSHKQEDIVSYYNKVSFKMQHYQNMNLTVLCTNEKDTKNLNKILKDMINKIQENEVNHN
jgi:hypothetical protein